MKKRIQSLDDYINESKYDFANHYSNILYYHLKNNPQSLSNKKIVDNWVDIIKGDKDYSLNNKQIEDLRKEAVTLSFEITPRFKQTMKSKIDRLLKNKKIR